MTAQLLSPANDEVTEFIKRLGVDPSMTRRVVIDIPMDGPVVAYVEMYASRGALEIITHADLAPEVKVIA